MAVIAPDGRVSVLRNDERTYFFEPFTQTAYFTLAEQTTAAATGDYAVVVIWIAPARFVAITGQVEQFPAAIENAEQLLRCPVDGQPQASASVSPTRLVIGEQFSRTS